MIKKSILLVLIIMFSQIDIFCFKLHIAKLNIYKDNIDVILDETEMEGTKLLYKYVSKKDYSGLIKTELVSEIQNPDNTVIKSKLEASELCELGQIKYLIYGYIKKTNKYYDAEIKLFDNEAKTVKKIFYNKAELGNYEDFINELADKLLKYMYIVSGESEKFIGFKRKFGGIGIYNSVGYWFPMSDWWEVITGLVCFETGVYVVPLSHFVGKKNLLLYMRFGFFVNYLLGMNKPGFLEAYYNSLVFKIPAEMCLEIFNRNVFTIGVAPQLQLDIIYQEKLYDDPYSNATACFSLGVNTAYEYWFGKNKNVAIGANNVFDFTFYNKVFIAYKLQLYSVYRIEIEKKK